MSYPTNATTGAPQCIANNGNDGEPEVPLWECPCGQCTALDWEACDDETRMDYGSLKVWRQTYFPEVWG